MSTETSPMANQSTLSKAVQAVEKYWIRIWAFLVILFLYTPIVVIVLFSFEQGSFSSFPWDGFTLEWYRTLLETPSAISATFNSLFVALFVTFFGTMLGTLGAIALVRHDFRLKEAYRMLVIAPMTIPGLILGVALLMMFNYLEITRTLRTVIIGQLVFVVPFVLVTVSSRLAGFDPTLEQAARDLGASKWTAYRRVTLPLLAPGIVSGALFAFTLSFDDFLIAFFTSGVENTLPIYIFSTIQRTQSPVINAISTIALLLSMLLILTSLYFRD